MLFAFSKRLLTQDDRWIIRATDKPSMIEKV